MQNTVECNCDNVVLPLPLGIKYAFCTAVKYHAAVFITDGKREKTIRFGLDVCIYPGANHNYCYSDRLDDITHLILPETREQ